MTQVRRGFCFFCFFYRKQEKLKKKYKNRRKCRVLGTEVKSRFQLHTSTFHFLVSSQEQGTSFFYPVYFCGNHLEVFSCFSFFCQFQASKPFFILLFCLNVIATEPISDRLKKSKSLQQLDGQLENNSVPSKQEKTKSNIFLCLLFKHRTQTAEELVMETESEQKHLDRPLSAQSSHSIRILGFKPNQKCFSLQGKMCGVGGDLLDVVGICYGC